MRLRTDAPRRTAIASLAVIVLLVAAPAYAYIDPSTGGMLTQLLTGGVAGLAVLARLYWQRFTRRVDSTSPADAVKDRSPDA